MNLMYYGREYIFIELLKGIIEIIGNMVNIEELIEIWNLKKYKF